MGIIIIITVALALLAWGYWYLKDVLWVTPPYHSFSFDSVKGVTPEGWIVFQQTKNGDQYDISLYGGEYTDNTGRRFKLEITQGSSNDPMSEFGSGATFIKELDSGKLSYYSKISSDTELGYGVVVKNRFEQDALYNLTFKFESPYSSADIEKAEQIIDGLYVR